MRAVCQQVLPISTEDGRDSYDPLTGASTTFAQLSTSDADDDLMCQILI